jgi:2-polyprenyl-3-methyl-5-hydroxy-6-metoxy-1,4-benzoquinol methylase
MEHVSCHFCGSLLGEPVVEGPDRMFPSAEIFRLILCNHCGLIYLDPRPTKAEIERYYPQTYAPYSNSSEKALPLMKRWAHRYGIRQRCQVVMSQKKHGGRLLDVGCATGTFLAAMREMGNWQVWGVETSMEASAQARQLGQLRVFNGELTEADFNDEYFDAVTLWDTLEHLHQPLEALREIWRILKPGGILVFRTPNVHSVNRRLFGPYWGGWDMPRHLHIFPLPILRQMLMQCDFEILQEFCPSGTYADFVISLRFLVVAKVRGERWRSLWLGLINPLVIQLVLFPYSYWADKTKRGAHMTVVARKPHRSTSHSSASD